MDEKLGHRTHTRDPKVWKYKDRYTLILGSKFIESGSDKFTGEVLFYTSEDGENWSYKNRYYDKKLQKQYYQSKKSSTTNIILTNFVEKTKIKVQEKQGEFRLKIKDDFYMKEVAGLSIVVATGDTAEDMNSMINLNETATFLWRQLENETTKEELIKKLTQEYDVDYKRASQSIDNFISKLDEIGCITL